MNQSGLQEGIDFTLDEEGRMVFSARYLLERGFCCGSGCRNCPYSKANRKTDDTKQEDEA